MKNKMPEFIEEYFFNEGLGSILYMAHCRSVEEEKRIWKRIEKLFLSDEAKYAWLEIRKHKKEVMRKLVRFEIVMELEGKLLPEEFIEELFSKEGGSKIEFIMQLCKKAKAPDIIQEWFNAGEFNEIYLFDDFLNKLYVLLEKHEFNKNGIIEKMSDDEYLDFAKNSFWYTDELIQSLYESKYLFDLTRCFVRILNYSIYDIKEKKPVNQAEKAKKVTVLIDELLDALKEWGRTLNMPDCYYEIKSPKDGLNKEERDLFDKYNERLSIRLERIKKAAENHYNKMKYKANVGVDDKHYAIKELIGFFKYYHGKKLLGTTATLASVLVGEDVTKEYVRDFYRKSYSRGGNN